MSYIGVDGSKDKWICVEITMGELPDIKILNTVEDIWDNYNNDEIILIDIPIGLRESGTQERFCDKEARRLLGWPRRCSVFRAPCRAVLDARDYNEARSISKEKIEKSLSIQTWSIKDKIKQVDDFLSGNSYARLKIREIHPELCLWALNGGRPMRFSKKTLEGLHERKQVLCRAYSQASEVINLATNKYKQKVALNDVIDALAAAVTAFLGKGRLLSIPENPEIDSNGLRMEMAYYILS